MKPPFTRCNITNFSAPTHETLRSYFEASWDCFEWLFSSLEDPAAFSSQPHPFRNALAFYYGHTAAFYVQKLRRVGLLGGPVDEELDLGLERGVWPKTSKEIATRQGWATRPRLHAYRGRVRERVLEALEGASLQGPIDREHPLWAFFMAVEHEHIHFQTSIPLLRRVPTSALRRPEGWRYASAHEANRGAAGARWITIPAGIVSRGRAHDESLSFGWDNEFGEITEALPSFEVRSRPTTNREYLEFVLDGGYGKPELWTTNEATCFFEGMRPTHPASWVPDGEGGYGYRGIFDELDMPWRWPVEINRHEAAAFAKWAGARLLREPEFHRLLELDAVSTHETLDPARYNVALRYGSPTAVGAHPEAVGLSQVELLGNVARWAEEDFLPIAAAQFRCHPLYADFSRPWFRGDHGVLLGAGFPAMGHLTQVRLMRDFMQNHMDQIAGITLVRDIPV